MPDLTYERINFEDAPSNQTPVNSTNLNKMDKGIYDATEEINNRQPKTDSNLQTNSKQTTGAINELNTGKIEKMTGVTGYQKVDVLGYNPTTKKLGMKVNGADTVINFSSFGAKLVGTYSSNTSINVSSLNATSASQFLLVPYTSQNASVGYAQGPYYGVGSKCEFTPGSLSLSGNTLSITLPKASGTWVINGYESQGSAQITVACKLYFVGEIS